MNQRERVMAAVRHREPDRVPLDLGGTRSTGIMAAAYPRLKQGLSISGGETCLMDPLLQLAYVEEPVRQALGCDAVFLYDLDGEWEDYFLPDGCPARIRRDFLREPDGLGGEYAHNRTWRRPAGSYYFDPLAYPLQDVDSLAGLGAYPWPGPPSAGSLAHLRETARRLHTETDYAVIGEWGAGTFLEGGQWLRGPVNFFMDLAGNPRFAEALLDRLVEEQLRDIELYLSDVGEFIDILQVNDDLGMQTRPQIHPDTYRRLIQPRQKIVWQRVHELAPHLAIMLHSCGEISPLIPGLIDAGLDILNPVQIAAPGMKPERLKAEFGKELCFWGGGCDTQSVLPYATPGEVVHHTRRNIEIFKPGGGYVFCQVHNLQVDVPTENMLAMYGALHEVWAYE
jgi:uroporphyrinogen decarboxylase